MYVSEITITEIENTKDLKKSIMLEYLAEIDFSIINVDEEVIQYAGEIIKLGILSDKHYFDCLHIACAVVSECNYLLSWNFKHIVRVKTINGIRTINAMFGYHGIDIYQPNLLIEGEDD